MSAELRESLSALMDGEASELEIRRLLRDGNAETDAFWSRINQQRNVMTDEPVFVGLDVSAAVRVAIGDEPVARRGQWYKPVAGIAVAASVAAMVVFGLGGVGGIVVPDGQMVAKVTSSPESGRVYLASPSIGANGAVTASVATSQVPVYRTIDDEQSRQRFERYLEQHTARAALNSGQGMVTYARLVSQGTE